MLQQHRVSCCDCLSVRDSTWRLASAASMCSLEQFFVLYCKSTITLPARL